ncbi:MAG: hypothetical protein M0039_03740 [Pseudomonadota bacterium]|nr:hypothetical protein [Pseudomonadota bacterium]
MKQVLVIAKFDQAEALRVAAGLTLMNDAVKVDVLGPLEESAAVNEQKEVIDFAEVQCEIVLANDLIKRIASDIMEADVVVVL